MKAAAPPHAPATRGIPHQRCSTAAEDAHAPNVDMEAKARYSNFTLRSGSSKFGASRAEKLHEPRVGYATAGLSGTFRPVRGADQKKKMKCKRKARRKSGQTPMLN